MDHFYFDGVERAAPSERSAIEPASNLVENGWTTVSTTQVEMDLGCCRVGRTKPCSLALRYPQNGVSLRRVNAEWMPSSISSEFRLYINGPRNGQKSYGTVPIVLLEGSGAAAHVIDSFDVNVDAFVQRARKRLWTWHPLTLGQAVYLADRSLETFSVNQGEFK
jgi:hypothetical protein